MGSGHNEASLPSGKFKLGKRNTWGLINNGKQAGLKTNVLLYTVLGTYNFSTCNLKTGRMSPTY